LSAAIKCQEKSEIFFPVLKYNIPSVSLDGAAFTGSYTENGTRADNGRPGCPTFDLEGKGEGETERLKKFVESKRKMGLRPRINI